jgi:hypothetical protein
MNYDAWLQSGPGGPLDDPKGPEVFVCHACGHETTDDREPCHCEAAQAAINDEWDAIYRAERMAVEVEVAGTGHASDELPPF